MLSLQRMFASDHADGSLEQMLLSPESLDSAVTFMPLVGVLLLLLTREDSAYGRRNILNVSLLTTIFTPYSPLHDGAVIVRGDTIVGAGCILPLSQSRIDDRSLGTRHRAALGLAEETDAIVIVVSEETATISVAQLGVLERPLTPAQVRDVLAGRPRRTTMEQPVVGATA